MINRLSYEEKLKCYGSATLERRMMGDSIKTYKLPVLTNKMEVPSERFFLTAWYTETQGHVGALDFTKRHLKHS